MWQRGPQKVLQFQSRGTLRAISCRLFPTGVMGEAAIGVAGGALPPELLLDEPPLDWLLVRLRHSLNCA